MEKTELQNTEKRGSYGQHTEKIHLIIEKHTHNQLRKNLAFCEPNSNFFVYMGRRLFVQYCGKDRTTFEIVELTEIKFKDEITLEIKRNTKKLWFKIAAEGGVFIGT